MLYSEHPCEGTEEYSRSSGTDEKNTSTCLATHATLFANFSAARNLYWTQLLNARQSTSGINA
jgi:hypothetical protein